MHRVVEKRETGLVLIELLVVLSIIGMVFVGVIFSGKKLIPKSQLEASAYEIISDFRRIQQQAISEQIDYGIRFDTTNDKYTIFNDNGDIETKRLARGINSEINFISNEVIFDPMGTSNLNGSVFLTNNNGEKYRIFIYHMTGRIKLKKIE